MNGEELVRKFEEDLVLWVNEAGTNADPEDMKELETNARKARIELIAYIRRLENNAPGML